MSIPGNVLKRRLKRWALLAAFLQVFAITLVPGADLPKPGSSIESASSRLEAAAALLATRKNAVTHGDVPSVNELSLVERRPLAGWDVPRALSAGLSDPLLDRARDLRVVDDFKQIADLAPRPLEPSKALALKNAVSIEDDKAALTRYLAEAYQKPVELAAVEGLAPARWTVKHADPKIRAAFAYTEETWAKLLRETRPAEGGSLLSSPYPVLIPAGRFQESYYWDTYFANLGLLATGRLDIARMQVENFLSSIRRYGFVPNGGRDYYLSRSQPPFVSSMVRDVHEASVAQASTAAEKAKLDRWLRERAYPLLKRDYETFWMDPKTHYDARTGLNHHWDDLNLPRPERHGSDNELTLGKTFRDVRAAAESGLDFTDAFGGEATRVAGPLLNSMLFKTETDLAWAAGRLGLRSDARKFNAARARRRAAIDRHLWNPKKGRYEPYHLKTGKRVDVFSADSFAPLFVGAASQEQAAKVRSSLPALERPGGIMASNLLASTHQWDGANGWAPFQVMAIRGLDRYGYSKDARRLASKWVDVLADIHSEEKTFYERVDVVGSKKPEIDAGKYPPQSGFLWTNGSFVWALVEVLKAPLSVGHRPPRGDFDSDPVDQPSHVPLPLEGARREDRSLQAVE